jgi:hypothetical protein
MYGEKVQLPDNDILPFSPSNMKLYNENFKKIETIYKTPLAATEINLVETEKGERYAAKEILKKKLRYSYSHEFIRNEMALQFSLSRICENIVPVLEYYEDDERYVMVMDYSKQPDYFDDLLENVNFTNLLRGIHL